MSDEEKPKRRRKKKAPVANKRPVGRPRLTPRLDDLDGPVIRKTQATVRAERSDLAVKITQSKKEVIARAHQSGIMPAEFMLKIMRGEAIEQTTWNEKTQELETKEVYPDLACRLDCAKACAGYFSPKLSTQTIDNRGDASQMADAIKALPGKLPKVGEPPK